MGVVNIHHFELGSRVSEVKFLQQFIRSIYEPSPLDFDVLAHAINLVQEEVAKMLA